MNLTLSIDKKVVERARKAAEGEGMSLNQAIRDYLVHLGGGGTVEEDVSEIARLSAASGGRSRGWKFNRDEAHERS